MKKSLWDFLWLLLFLLLLLPLLLIKSGQKHIRNVSKSLTKMVYICCFSQIQTTFPENTSCGSGSGIKMNL